MMYNSVIGLLLIFGVILILLALFTMMYPENSNTVKKEKKLVGDNWLDEVVDSGMFVGGEIGRASCRERV